MANNFSLTTINSRRSSRCGNSTDRSLSYQTVCHQANGHQTFVCSGVRIFADFVFREPKPLEEQTMVNFSAGHIRNGGFAYQICSVIITQILLNSEKKFNDQCYSRPTQVVTPPKGVLRSLCSRVFTHKTPLSICSAIVLLWWYWLSNRACKSVFCDISH